MQLGIRLKSLIVITIVAILLATSAPLVWAQAADAAEDASGTENSELPAMLVADSVFITPDRELIAEGNVEAFYGETRLRAHKISYNRENTTLYIEGPIRIDQGESYSVLASSAELDKDLQNGLLRGARLVFDQQLQLASLQMTRVNGRYTQLYKSAVTSCNVCEDGRPPLWQIRARKITHDQLERQLYFENAQLRVLDVPIFYFPALRLPDPSLDRANGFLIPSIRNTSRLGTGVKVPYFFRLGDHKDLTLIPYLSPKTRSLGYRYRQAFKTGRIQLDGAFTRDDLLPGEDRGYLFGFGNFTLPKDFNLSFDFKTVSDSAYLSDYGLPNLDRLRSGIALSRVKRDTGFQVSIINYESLRDNVVESQVPSQIFDLNYEKRFFPTTIGGELRLNANAHSHTRLSTENVLGRDVKRGTLDANWRRDWLFNNGLRADWLVGLSGDTSKIGDDTNYPSQLNRITPRSSVTLRLPMTTQDAKGGTQFLEPIVQLGWADVIGDDFPNDESTYVEFDQGNLLSLSRFPADDQREDGVTLVYGLNWSRFAFNGWQASATVGQVLRNKANPQFTETSGLSGTTSDFLLAGQIKLKQGLSLTGRGLLNNSFSFSKVELRGDWIKDNYFVSSTYLWGAADPAEGRNSDASELWLDTAYGIDQNWTARANLRYNFADSTPSKAGVGIVYTNECLTVDLSVRRSYTTTSTVEPTTDFGFTVSINGFAVDGGPKTNRRSCKNS